MSKVAKEYITFEMGLQVEVDIQDGMSPADIEEALEAQAIADIRSLVGFEMGDQEILEHVDFPSAWKEYEDED